MKLKAMLLVVISMVTALSTSAHAMRESGGREGATAVFVDFWSYGTGIDADGYEFVAERIEFNYNRGKVVTDTQSAPGREGETLRCVQFVDPTTAFQFISAIAPMLINDEMMNGRVRTSVSTGFSCDDYAAAQMVNLYDYMR